MICAAVSPWKVDIYRLAADLDAASADPLVRPSCPSTSQGAVDATSFVNPGLECIDLLPEEEDDETGGSEMVDIHCRVALEYS